MITPENLRIHELIGLAVRVSGSLSAPYLGIEGRVADETKNTLVILGKDGVPRRVPKKGCVFQFILPSGGKAELDGESIAFRQYDRAKKAKR